MGNLEVKSKKENGTENETEKQETKTKNKKVLILFALMNICVLSAIFIMFAIDATSGVIEEGIMNFWAMIGSLGAFICSFLVLVIYLGSKIKEVFK